MSAPRLLRLRDVMSRTGLCRSSVYALMKAGTFPTSIALGDAAVAWIESEITAWIAARIRAARPDPTPATGLRGIAGVSVDDDTTPAA